MQYRDFGRTGWKVSEISFGAWAIGSSWGEVDDEESMAAMQRALDMGVNLFDTADVYGDGRSERLSWWPDTLPPTLRRELRLAAAARVASRRDQPVAP